MIHERKRALDFSDRHQYLGASEVGAAIGLSPYKTQHDLWSEKTLRKPRDGHKPIFERGHTMEGVVLQKLTEAGVAVSGTQAEASTENREWLVSHLDGMVNLDGGQIDCLRDLGIDVPDFVGGPGVLEIKSPGSNMTSSYKSKGATSDNVAQLLVNMFNAGTEWGVIIYMDYDNWQLNAIFMENNAKILDSVLSRLDDFWTAVVEDVEPEIPDDPDDATPAPLPTPKNTAELDDRSFTESYMASLKNLAAAQEDVATRKDSITTYMEENKFTGVNICDTVRCTLVQSKESVTYDGKTLYPWAVELAEAVDGGDTDKAEKMAGNILKDPMLFKKVRAGSAYYKFTPSKYEADND